ncbi:helix-turn-helix protein, partial [Acidomonas methanolica]|uniref:IS5 family transposase n=1 Tax=Acidomonas methanolica TaxID=437 RepID=UPI001047C6F5
RAEGHVVNRKRVRRLMRAMGIAALGPKPRTTIPAPGHKIYPYLLRDLVIDRANQVWGPKEPLPLLIDSTEIKVEGDGEWHTRKHGGSKRRIWRKLHIGIDERTLEIRAAEITGNDVGDAPVLPMLLAQIPQDEEIGSVTADGAYDTRSCHDIIAKRGADAIIPPRRNAKPWRPTTPGARARNEAIRASERFGRAIWRRWSGYHRRSRVETKMHCIKLLGQRLTARDFDRQVSEFYLRIAILNRFTALGTPLTEAIQ